MKTKLISNCVISLPCASLATSNALLMFHFRALFLKRGAKFLYGRSGKCFSWTAFTDFCVKSLESTPPLSFLILKSRWSFKYLFSPKFLLDPFSFLLAYLWLIMGWCLEKLEVRIQYNVPFNFIVP